MQSFPMSHFLRLDSQGSVDFQKSFLSDGRHLAGTRLAVLRGAGDLGSMGDCPSCPWSNPV